MPGQQRPAMGNDNFAAAPSGTFATADGMLNISANEQRQFTALCRVLGRHELADDSRFAERGARKTHRHELNGEMEKALAERHAPEWEPLTDAAGVPAARVLSVPAAL